MDWLNQIQSTAVESPYAALLGVAMSIPVHHYLIGCLLILTVLMYNFLELHFLEDLLTGFRGQPVTLTFDPCSQVYRDVVSKCKVLHGRYLSTPWLCSPHLQTAFLHYFGNAPVVDYRRQIFMTSDGGTLALDWVMNSGGKRPAIEQNGPMQQYSRNPIVIIIPGLTSDSNSNYVKHLAFSMAKRGWNVVVSNHRGLGGVPITSDQFYHGGWTEDVRRVIDHIHCQYSEAPLFVVGTSIGANILVKYLAEEGINVPIVGAVAICSPWDLAICDRYLRRGLRQRFYNKALTVGLIDYAHSHEAVLSRLLNWEGVKKSLSVRDFDDSATRIVGKYKTVDAYYRHVSSANFVGSVMVPLLCISSLDDPICTREAIPWDDCRLNSNVVLATTPHGGHLPFFEGLSAKTVWWVRAVDEFFCALQSSPLSYRKKEMLVASVPDSSINQASDEHVSDDGKGAAVASEIADTDQNETENSLGAEKSVTDSQNDKNDLAPALAVAHSPEQDIGSNIVTPVKKCLNQLSRQNRKSLWLLAYIAAITTWPVVGSVLAAFLRKKFNNLLSRGSVRR